MGAFEIRTAVINRLKADVAVLYSPAGLVQGGIWDRELKLESPGATPEAFYRNPSDPANINRLKTNIVIYGPNDVDPPDGALNAPRDEPQLRNGFLRLFYYAPMSTTGKQTLDAIDDRVAWLLEGWQAVLASGYPFTTSFVDKTEELPSDQFPGNLVVERRVLAEYWRVIAP